MQHLTDQAYGIVRQPKRRRLNQAESVTLSHCEDRLTATAGNEGHQFDRTVVAGQARAHFGDNINHHNHYHGSHEVDPYAILLDSLKFERMEARCSNVAPALAHTCDWIFQTRQFQAWSRPQRDEDRFLWIKGKPGCGKSTIMKTLLQCDRSTVPEEITVSYFFNARATEALEKSSLGLYRSLVHQILSQVDLRSHFLRKFSWKVMKDRVDPWTATELMDFLVQLVQGSRIPQLCIFIDAMDEGDKSDIQQLFSFLKDLQDHAIRSSMWLRICLSSRHFPYINVGKALMLILEEESDHDGDIELYVKSKLTGDEGPELEDLRHQVCQKSQGVFLWVVLVVPMLNNVFDEGGSLERKINHLQEIPAELDDLFTDILSKSREDLEDSVALLQCVLVANRSLNPQELWCAMHYSQKDTKVSLPTEQSKAEGMTADVPDLARISRRLLHCSRGLVESTTSEPIVIQFIHETVRAFLLSPDGLGRFLPDSRMPGVVGSCHETIRDACFRCVKHLPSQASLYQYGYRFKEPFQQYAVRNLLVHANMAQNFEHSQVQWLEDLKTSGILPKWRNQWNATYSENDQNYLYSNCLLCILANLQMLSLLRQFHDVDGRLFSYCDHIVGIHRVHRFKLPSRQEIIRVLVDMGVDIDSLD